MMRFVISGSLGSQGCETVSQHANKKFGWHGSDRAFCSSVKATNFGQKRFMMNFRARSMEKVVLDGAEGLGEDGVEVKTYPTRRLSSQEALDAWSSMSRQNVDSNSHVEEMVSFYSSELGGIVNDPGMMGVAVNESLVHSGHGVYEKFRVIDGYVYQMNDRLDRLMLSAAKANIQLPKKWSKAQLERIILETIAAGKILQGHVTVFLSIGRGSYGHPVVSPSRAAMYVIVNKLDESVAESDEYLRGWHVKTSPVPCKSPYFATLKSTDRFQDTMAIMDANAEGYQTGIFIDDEGYVAGAPDANVVFLMENDELVFPPVTHAVPTLSMLRLMEVSSFALADGDLSVSKISQRRISLEEAKSSKEAMLVGSQFPVMPIVKWDEHVLGEGDVGIVSLQLRVLLQADVQYSEKSSNHTEVPYGYLTGMEAE
eukprot:jgi/Picsp_1/2229/NSC_05693-R1_branched-chain-amino-acid aminotransferase-like protein chloroplastic-like